MKKLIILAILAIPLGAYAWESFMDKCISTWIGYPLNSVIKKWGYPDQEKSIAGKKLYIWETVDYDYNSVVTENGFSITSTDKKGRDTTFFIGSETPQLEYCKKTLEVDNEGIIINGQWTGNACPKFYFVGKKYVNPENDTWSKNK